MIRRPPRSTRSDTLVPYTTLFRSLCGFVYVVDQRLNLPNRCFVNWPDRLAATLAFDRSPQAQRLVSEVQHETACRAVRLRPDVVEFVRNRSSYHTDGAPAPQRCPQPFEISYTCFFYSGESYQHAIVSGPRRERDRLGNGGYDSVR